MHPAVPGAFSVHSRKTIKVLLYLALGRVMLALLTEVISLRFECFLVVPSVSW